MSYAFVEDVAASWERYARFAAAFAGPSPPGLIVHVAGPTDEGFRIIGVWESEADWLRFLRDRLDGALSAPPALLAPPAFRSLRPIHVVFGRREEGRCGID
ncbi:MAG: hypothetical protein ICV64_06600 [Thermoleophilia bacterium]|nr:hypothetical protein [Thermoleophilia bacterium]